MGMYDEVMVRVPLPGGPARQPFQTKDLECELATYEITADGRLVYEERDINHTGELRFYSIDHDTRHWHEYVATFIRGDLDSIRKVSDGPNDRELPLHKQSVLLYARGKPIAAGSRQPCLACSGRGWTTSEAPSTADTLLELLRRSHTIIAGASVTNASPTLRQLLKDIETALDAPAAKGR